MVEVINILENLLVMLKEGFYNKLFIMLHDKSLIGLLGLRLILIGWWRRLVLFRNQRQKFSLRPNIVLVYLQRKARQLLKLLVQLNFVKKLNLIWVGLSIGGTKIEYIFRKFICM